MEGVVCYVGWAFADYSGFGRLSVNKAVSNAKIGETIGRFSEST